MAVKAVYANHPITKAAMWVLHPSQWGSCCACLNEMYEIRRTTEVQAAESLDYHVYLQTADQVANPRNRLMLTKFIQSDFFQNLSGGIRINRVYDSIKGKNVFNTGEMRKPFVIHLSFDMKKNPASGLVTALRLINQCCNIADSLLVKVSDDDLQYVPLIFAIAQGTYHHSDGSVSFVSTKASEVATFARQNDNHDLDDLYYDEFICDHFGDSGQGAVNLNMAARIWVRTAEDFLERSNQRQSLYHNQGYMKDESIIGRQESRIWATIDGDEPDFEMSISGPVIDVELSTDSKPAQSQFMNPWDRSGDNLAASVEALKTLLNN